MVNVRQWDRAGDIDSSLVLLFEVDVWRLLVDPDTEAFKLALDNAFVRERLVNVEYDEYQITSLRDSNDLPTAAFAILGSLNNTRQIEHLNLCAVVYDLSRHCCKLHTHKYC